MARDVARIEFLLGWMHQGGYAKSGTWETDGANDGPFPDHIQAEMHGGRKDKWCIQFAGYVHKVMGFRFEKLTVLSRKQRQKDIVRHSIFRSGSRFRHWARTGVNYVRSKERMTPKTETLKKGLEGGFSYVLRSWEDMAQQSHSPRAGDIISWKGKTRIKPARHWKAWKKTAHTVLIDDAEGSVVYTVEGNNGDGAGARKIDLSSPDTARHEWRMQWIHWARPGLDWYTDEDHSARQLRVLSDDVLNGDFNFISLFAPSREAVMLETSRLVQTLAEFCADDSLHAGPWIKNHDATSRVWDWTDREVRIGVL